MQKNNNQEPSKFRAFLSSDTVKGLLPFIGFVVIVVVMNILTEGKILTPKRIRMVYPSVDKPANLVLIEGQKEAAPLLHQEPPLIVHEKDGQESEEIRRIYHLESET